MSIPLSIAAYFTTWWVVLFAVLPFGVKAPHEAGPTNLPPGVDPGAPLAPMLVRKLLWTSLISALLFVALDAFVFWVD